MMTVFNVDIPNLFRLTKLKIHCILIAIVALVVCKPKPVHCSGQLNYSG